VKLKFWLLDINPKIDDDSVELWLWGIDTLGNRLLVVDRSFVAYFYAVLTDGADASNVRAEIISAFGSSIVKIEAAERRFFGKPVHAVKVYCRNTKQMGVLAKGVRRLEGVKECLEDDIRVPIRYLIDNSIVPCSWLELEANEEENRLGVRVSKVYSAKSPPKQLDSIIKPSLRILGFSMISYSREGSPKPDRNPVVIISTVANSGEKRQFTAGQDDNDKIVI
jgi:DNA polymerase I